MSEFIWTEALGCAEILEPMLRSFTHHHPESVINVVVYERDLDLLSNFPHVIALPVNDASISVSEAELQKAYSLGHRGTALLWSRLIQQRKEDRLIHFDSDLVFLDEVVSWLKDALVSDVVVAGPRRPYRHGPQLPPPHRFFQRFMPDAVHTYAFGFDPAPLRGMSDARLQELIYGAKPRSLANIVRPNLDFFDRAARALLQHGRVDYLDGKPTVHGHHDPGSPFNSRVITFAAVGTGYALFKSGRPALSPYQKFSLRSFATYSRHLLDLDLGLPEISDEYLQMQLRRLDKNTWSLAHE